jgi:hypothetical protein
VASNNPANLLMLREIQTFFNNIGRIDIKPSDNTIRFITNSLGDCLIIINHFLAYPLLTYKLVYFYI